MLFQIRPPARRTADRSQADPRRLGGAREHLDLQSQGREPVPRDLAERRAGAAGVQAAARAAGAARRGHPHARLRAPGRAGGTGRQARAGDARVPVGVGPEADRAPGCACAGSAPARGRQRVRRAPTATRSRSRRSTASRSPATRARARSRTRPIRKLLTLQGVNRPLRIVSLTSIPGADERARQAERARLRLCRVQPAERASGARARRERVRLGAERERVDQADRAPRRDPRPDGRQRTLDGGDPRQARNARAERWPAGGGSATPWALSGEPGGAARQGAGTTGAATSEGGAGGHG